MPSPSRSLFVAGFGEGPDHGLSRYVRSASGWSGTLVAKAVNLVAVARHPRLPLVYGVSAAAMGPLYVWHVNAAGVRQIGTYTTGGQLACSVALDAHGHWLAIANYGSASLTVWRLDAEGRPVGAGRVHELHGRGIDVERQSASHPHQVLFDADRLVVPDLGADLVRVLRIESSGELSIIRNERMPPGAGPRHLVGLPGGGYAATAELSSDVLFGQPTPAGGIEWGVLRSTTVPGESGERNFPGDIQRSRAGDRVYVLNRGNDTLATFLVSAEGPRLVAETSTGIQWPHHMVVCDDAVLIASRRDSMVVSMPLTGGIPGEPVAAFGCPGATALLVERRRAAQG